LTRGIVACACRAMKRPHNTIEWVFLSLMAGFALTTTGGHSSAAEAAAQSVPGSIAAPGADRVADPHWVTDPTYPGPDLPPRGRSLFDFLVAEKRGGNVVQVVPFPFASLLRKVEKAMRHDGATGLQSVLIPLGRSLQRTAAAPDFFAYPRAVVAADGEPRDSAGLFLKDRLYFGYQEKAGVLEVISYNEDAARFEFQVITDYRAGGTPRIAYASRALCTACHQAGTPIFSRQVWDETNANPDINALLAAQRKNFYGIRVDHGVDVPNAIDDAKLRANRFVVDQLLWTEGCGGADPSAVRCRTALFVAALQYRLTGQQQFDTSAASFRDETLGALSRSARQRWPDGLALGNPDLPNRNPLSGIRPASLASAASHGAELVDVGAPFDPLRLRPPLEIWRIEKEKDVVRLVAGLAEFIAQADVEHLDRELYRRTSAIGVVRRVHHGTCRMTPSALMQGSQRIEFSCKRGSDGKEVLAVDGHLTFTAGALVGGVIDRLEIEGQPALRDIDLTTRALATAGSKRAAVLTLRRGSLRARNAAGNAFEQMDMRWDGGDGTASVSVVDDFAPVRIAVAALERDTLDGGFDGFADFPFRRARLMPALFAGLGAARGAWCCLDASSLPPAQTLPVGEHGPPAAAHAAFHQYCASCHQGTLPQPPNFLAGDASAIERKLRQCAPRMFVRLSMWRREPDTRVKTPMPPDVALHRFNVSAVDWRDGEALSGLITSVGERLRAETGTAPELTALLRQGYENLRPCLPGERR
jgi:hypothetical protein